MFTGPRNQPAKDSISITATLESSHTTRIAESIVTLDRFDRIYEIHRLLSGARRAVTPARIDEALECSPATRKRIIHNMRLFLNAPIVYDREQQGYRYETGTDGGMYELPGLWFNASELHALLAMRELLSNVQPGMLDEQLSPIANRIHGLLDIVRPGDKDISQCIRIIGIAHRAPGRHFQTIAGAIVQGRRLTIEYRSRVNGEISIRDVSPQRLIHYRDNWYLDAWCHLRNDLRSFAVEEIVLAKAGTPAAITVSDQLLKQHFSSAYGIFAGAADKTAVLRFCTPRARWVAREQWHPEQTGEWLDDNHYELRVPYGNPTELVMDILRHGNFVEVIAPASLRKAVKRQLRAALDAYTSRMGQTQGEREENN